MKILYIYRKFYQNIVYFIDNATGILYFFKTKEKIISMIHVVHSKFVTDFIAYNYNVIKLFKNLKKEELSLYKKKNYVNIFRKFMYTNC